MSRKDKYLQELCEAKKRIQQLEDENRRLRGTIHRLVELKNEMEAKTPNTVILPEVRISHADIGVQ